jgi:hypothetical protein
VRILAEHGAGSYLMCASAVSRKVCVRDATLPVVVTADNFVTAVELVQASLPEAGAAVGSCASFQVRGSEAACSLVRRWVRAAAGRGGGCLGG